MIPQSTQCVVVGGLCRWQRGQGIEFDALRIGGTADVVLTSWVGWLFAGRGGKELRATADIRLLSAVNDVPHSGQKLLPGVTGCPQCVQCLRGSGGRTPLPKVGTSGRPTMGVPTPSAKRASVGRASL